MDKTAFYAALRRRDSGAFGTSLSQAQVDGIEAILAECLRVGCDLGQTAYILATAYGETGGKMQPRRENMNYSAKRLMQVWPKRFPTLASTQGYAGNPKALAIKVYGSRMGNRPGTSDGWDFRGAGIGQITGRDNFTRWGERLGIPLLSNPELLEKLDVSVKALVRPMMEGWATGKKLPDYVKGDRHDYTGARAVWGGVDAPKYERLARSFEVALEAGGWRVDPPRADWAPDPAEKPQGLWAAIFAALAAVFGGRK